MQTEEQNSTSTNQSDSGSDAEFVGWQKTKSGDSVALYNITASGHPSYGSTVSENSLQRMNLQIPETPPPPDSI